MYVLCKLEESRRDGSVYSHPMSAIVRSESIVEISDEIRKRVEAGCPVHRLRVFKEVPFETAIGITWQAQTETGTITFD